MIPVYQSKQNNKFSNCFSACVASLLELDAQAVPDFMYEADGRTLNDHWFDDFAQWLRPFGYQPLLFTPENLDCFPLRDTYYIIGGKVDIGIMHAAIGLNDEVVHNPNPAHANIVEIVDYIVFVRTFL